ncbi:MAG TPA: haloacid dehalogenase type II [Myxococcales bacterium]|nr:haloacid dehalogenase type II [Myxococcales bacterium]
MNRFSRRQLLAMAGAAALPGSERFRAVAYDGFTLFDPRPIGAVAARFFAARAPELMNLWRVKQFDYQWLRSLSGRYEDFWKVTESALRFAARTLQLPLAPESRDALMGAWLELKAWPDVAPSVRALKDAGLRQAPLANMTNEILDAAIRGSRLDGLFDDVISTDRNRTFKPDPRAYQLGVDALGLRKSEVLFAPSAGWDAAGARWFGYPTFWVNRLAVPAEELGVAADATGATMSNLVTFATGRAG